jgi:aminobenzoyl-glutamate transport protein
MLPLSVGAPMENSNSGPNSKTKLVRVLEAVERVGNALPQPALLFLLLTGVVILVSFVAHTLGFSAVHPIKKDNLVVLNLLSMAGLHYLLTDMVKNFTGFAPLGTVLVAMLGFSFAEKSGLLSTVLRLLVLKSPRFLIVPVVLLAGILSHTAGDVGYVLLIPLAAMVFHSAGLHPLAGLAASFAGVSGGFAANFLLSTADTLLGGLSQEAARIIDPQFVVTPVANWYFMASSSLLIILIGTLVTNRIIIPYLGDYKGEAPLAALDRLSLSERRGLWAAGWAGAVIFILLLLGTIPESGFLRDPVNGSLLSSPLLKGIVPLIFVIGAATGLAYGFTAKTFKNQSDVINAMQESMVMMAPYLVLVFFASQFIALFNHSNMGVILAVHGSEALKTMNMSGAFLMICFIFLTVILDLFIGSASAKWALMAPIFVPMFMLLGYSPALTQASYRIGDSVVNIISPLMSYFPLILAFMNKYEPKARVGTLIAIMLPYSISFLIFWSAMLFLWMTFGWDMGPGAGLWYSLPQ